MKRLISFLIVGIVSVGICSVSQAAVSNPGRIGLRGGLGTDISGGLAYGAAANYQLGVEGNVVEMGVSFYGGSYKEDKDTGFHTYKETTDLFVFGVLANYLINYSIENPGLFFVAGAGLAAINVSWTEESETDSSLGTLLPGGGSKQSIEETVAGSILNVGIGTNFENGLDVRFEVPTILLFGAPGNAATVVPTFTLTAGITL